MKIYHSNLFVSGVIFGMTLSFYMEHNIFPVILFLTASANLGFYIIRSRE